MNAHDDALALLDELLDLAGAERDARLAQIAARDAALADTLAGWLRADARGDEFRRASAIDAAAAHPASIPIEFRRPA